MSATESPPAWDGGRGRLVLAALHTGIGAVIIALVAHNYYGAWTQVTLGAAVGSIGTAVQLRHSLAVARDARPAGWPGTLLVLIGLTVAAVGSTDYNQVYLLWYVAASGAMLLRGRLALAAVTVPALVSLMPNANEVVTGDAAVAWAAHRAYTLVIFLIGVGLLYWAARLLSMLDRLSATRTRLAEVAVEAEQRRISRDLHDLLGQSLSAVALKGDLAIRLLPTDPAAALTEIESLTTVAGDAARSARTVAHQQRRLSLTAEMDAAVALLEAAGVTVTCGPVPPHLSRQVEDLFAWAVREATTNVLRHSNAHVCHIMAEPSADNTRLTIVSDGAHRPTGQHRGLAGLAARAHLIAGTVSAGPIRGGRFRLTVEVPQGDA